MSCEKITVVVVEPEKEPYVKEIDRGYKSLQSAVGGIFQILYPFEDRVAIVCNDEGKLIGLPLNRALRDEAGEVYDIIAGTFLVVGLSEEDTDSLSNELQKKYLETFKKPEFFIFCNREIIVYN